MEKSCWSREAAPYLDSAGRRLSANFMRAANIAGRYLTAHSCSERSGTIRFLPSSVSEEFL